MGDFYQQTDEALAIMGPLVSMLAGCSCVGSGPDMLVGLAYQRLLRHDMWAASCTGLFWISKSYVALKWWNVSLVSRKRSHNWGRWVIPSPKKKEKVQYAMRNPCVGNITSGL